MNSRIGLLTGLLVAQLVIIAAALLLDAREAGNAANLLSLTPSEVDSVIIADADQSLTLTRNDGKWQVGAFPADSAKVDKLISDFAGFSTPWPVATTSGSAERFEVSEDKFQRRVSFRKGDAVLAEVFLGTSPGFQRVHARAAGSEDVFAIAFSNYQAPVKAEDWLDKAMLAAVAPVKSILSPAGWKLEKGTEGWLLDGVAADQEKAGLYTERFENLRILGEADAGAQSQGVDKGTFTVTDGGGDYTLQLHQGADASDYTVRSSRVDGAFKMAAYIAEQLLNDGGDLSATPSESGPDPESPHPATDAESDDNVAPE
ncbi:MAG: DUF4340 domain-containing protein [Pseudomonadales bacterium]